MKRKFKYEQHAAAEAISNSGKRYARICDQAEGYACLVDDSTTESDIAADFLATYEGTANFTPEVVIYGPSPVEQEADLREAHGPSMRDNATRLVTLPVPVGATNMTNAELIWDETIADNHGWLVRVGDSVYPPAPAVSHMSADPDIDDDDKAEIVAATIKWNFSTERRERCKI